MKFVKNSSGLELLPNISFWLAVQENIKVCYNKYTAFLFFSQFNFNFKRTDFHSLCKNSGLREKAMKTSNELLLHFSLNC